MRSHSVALLPGDGVGPEVVAEAVKVLRAAARLDGGFELAMEEISIGAGEYLRSGEAMSEQAFQRIRAKDAVLLGAMGLPSVRLPSGVEIAPQLDLRERLDLYAGLRPIRLYHPRFSPLASKRAGSIDLLLVRENTEGMFWSRKGSLVANDDERIDGLRISRAGSERLFRAAFEQARARRGKVTLVDKANVLPSLAFFRGIFDEVAAEFPDIETERIYVDAAALYLVRRPESFDVMVTENMFGDILSDLAAGLIGGMGMAPSGDIGDRHAVFQPSHGSAPDIAGQGVANPTATILSAALLLDWLGEKEAAGAVSRAVERALNDPAQWTRDLGGEQSCAGLGDAVVAQLG
ncbi:MAG: isocitrate/isopropylmalate dehydrogenase family protein [Acidobacteria bacterium]|nr:isocitrate/isopropylmalate dehydrogenase family protein [Acidobacteriota bacterium]